MFRGDARRTGRADGEFPMLEVRDRVVLPTYPEVAKALAPPAGGVPTAGPMLPGFVPIAVAGKIVYRGPDGLHALDAETGKELWRTSRRRAARPCAWPRCSRTTTSASSC